MAKKTIGETLCEKVLSYDSMGHYKPLNRVGRIEFESGHSKFGLFQAAPPQLVNNAPNSCYSIWFRQDQAIVGALLGSCADVVQPLISTAETAHAAWQNLHSSFATTSRGRIVFLKSKLGKNPRGNRSITDYLHDMRTIADELALVQSPISEEDLVVHVLNQVGPDYDPISSAALLRPSAISVTPQNIP
ncbi:unnamed protein product [Cuscuta campestris]|uniref:Retrotransposon Copia-like N-terminal domain-containing protein n=1 Tax=Cuscuta campestris TaxID=132261 RepID=A0A484KCK9_9ASTE|nr:unnamed protein product [Cuscuta campestris]